MIVTSYEFPGLPGHRPEPQARVLCFWGYALHERIGAGLRRWATSLPFGSIRVESKATGLSDEQPNCHEAIQPFVAVAIHVARGLGARPPASAPVAPLELMSDVREVIRSCRQNTLVLELTKTQRMLNKINAFCTLIRYIVWMTESVTSELIYGVLKKVRDDVAFIRRKVEDHDEQFKGLRHLLIAMQSDDLRLDATIASLRVDVDRIKKRLELTDA